MAAWERDDYLHFMEEAATAGIGDRSRWVTAGALVKTSWQLRSSDLTVEAAFAELESMSEEGLLEREAAPVGGWGDGPHETMDVAQEAVRFLITTNGEASILDRTHGSVIIPPVAICNPDRFDGFTWRWARCTDFLQRGHTQWRGGIGTRGHTPAFYRRLAAQARDFIDGPGL
jgi:hypothetical protein